MNTYVRHVKVDDLDSIFAKINEHAHVNTKERKVRLNVHGYSVGVTSLRLRTFANAKLTQGLTNICCVKCGLQAAFFAVEVDQWAPEGTKPHLNLYGLKEGAEEVLFTHDHVLARSLGGRDHISNTQVMCSPCNAEKATGEQAEVERRRAAS